MNNFEDIVKKIKLRNISESDRDRLWTNILQARSRPSVAVPSIFIRYSFTNNMGVIAIILALVIGTSSTALAANEAKPGDVLYGIDKGLEEVRYSLASESGKEKLKVKFAEERVEEFGEVLAEDTEQIESSSSTVPSDPVDLSGKTITEVEIDVFTDISVVKVEAGDEKYYFTTTAMDSADVIKNAAVFFNVNEDVLTKLAIVEIEDRASRPKDRGVAVDLEDEHVQEGYDGVVTALAALGTSAQSDDMKSMLAALLSAYVAEDIIEDMDIRFSDGTRIDVNNGDFKYKSDDIEIKIKDGEVEIKDKDKDDNDDSDKDDDDEEDDDKGHGNDDAMNENNFGSMSDDDEDESDDSEDMDDSNDDSENDSDDDSDKDEDQDEEDDNSGSGNDDNEDEDENEDENDDDNSGHGNGGDDSEDDD